MDMINRTISYGVVEYASPHIRLSNDTPVTQKIILTGTKEHTIKLKFTKNYKKIYGEEPHIIKIKLYRKKFSMPVTDFMAFNNYDGGLENDS